MANQQIQFAETIRAMKLALKRRAEDADPDDITHFPSSSNRGHKSQRTTYLRHDHLNTTLPRSAYRKKISHAGYIRHVISTNPRLYDAEGEVVDPADSDAERDDVGTLVEDPFGQVKLEELFRPLTAAAELPDHPSLSIPYTSAALTRMVQEAGEMVRREREMLWKAKRLLRRFRGDADWVPCETFQTEGDELLLIPVQDEGDLATSAVPSVTLEQDVVHDEHERRHEIAMKMDLDTNGGEADGIEALDMAIQQAAVEVAKSSIEDTNDATSANKDAHLEEGATENDAPVKQPDGEQQPADPSMAIESTAQDPDALSEHTSTSGKDANERHAMTTRARARSPHASDAPGSPTPSSSPSTPKVHPWYTVPRTALPDRDLGLPPAEAEESRRSLLLYVQKQEHIVRQLGSLHEGLLKADRMRYDVYRACKAEAHMRIHPQTGLKVTDMSDGEDWYDVTELGLGAGELKVGKGGILGLEKGRDEVEEGGGEEEGRRGGVGGRKRRVGVGR